MTKNDYTTVGQNGEILPKARLRRIAGIKPGDKVIIQASFGELIIRKILTIEESLALPKFAKYSSEGAEAAINAESKGIEERVN